MVADDAAGAGVPVVCLPMLGMSRVATALAFGQRWPARATCARGTWTCPVTVTPQAREQQRRTVLDSVADWLERHLERPALLAGASYGAYLAAGIARQPPELVGGLLLVCPGIRVGAHERTPASAGAACCREGWLDAAPAELHGHLDRALGHRTRAVVDAVLHPGRGRPR